MLRFFSKLFEWISTIFAVLSPVAVLHWLLKVGNVQFILQPLAFLDSIFAPFNQLVDWVIPTAAIMYQGQEVYLNQAITGVFFTLLFFGFMTLSRWVTRLDNQMKLMKEVHKSNKAADKEREKQERLEEQHANYSQVLVYVAFPFREFPELGKVLQQYPVYEGRALPGNPNSLFIGFDDLQMALNFTIQTTATLGKFYSSQLPSEPKPPFSFVVHALWSTDRLEDGLSACTQLARFTGDGQTLLSESLRKVMHARGLLNDYQQHSLGYYSFPGGHSQEVFMLQPVLPAQAGQYY